MPEQLPVHLQNLPMEGFLQDDRDIASPPRISLIQAMSEKATEGLAKAGDFWSDAQQRVLVQPVPIVPLLEGKEWIKFTDDFKIEWRVTDPQDPRATFEHLTANLLVLLDGQPEILTFRSSALRAFRAFHGEAKMKNSPLFAQKWRLSSRLETAKNGKKFWMPVLNFDGFLDAAGFAKARETFEAFRKVFEQREEPDDLPEPPVAAITGPGEFRQQESHLAAMRAENAPQGNVSPLPPSSQQRAFADKLADKAGRLGWDSDGVVQHPEDIEDPNPPKQLGDVLTPSSEQRMRSDLIRDCQLLLKDVVGPYAIKRPEDAKDVIEQVFGVRPAALSMMNELLACRSTNELIDGVEALKKMRVPF